VNYYDLDPDEQRRLSASRLFNYLRRDIVPYHPFLRRLYQKSGVDVSRLRSPDDVRRLPIIDKSDLQADPLAFVLRPAIPGAAGHKDYETEPLRKSALARYALQALFDIPREYTRLVRAPSFREKIRRRGLLEWQPIHQHVSTGSTGSPTPVLFSHRDLTRNIAELASMVGCPKQPKADRQYFTVTDRSMSVFPGAPHVAFFGPVLAKTMAGMPTFETFGGAVIPTDRQIAIFAGGGFSTLLAVPSYLVYWLRRANTLRAEEKIGPLTDFKRAVVGAEPLSEPLRKYIRGLAIEAGAASQFAIFQTYGLTELKWTSMECAEAGGIHLNPKFYYWEMLHPETREPVGPGEPGVLVFSHIGWRGTALIRFWTGDLVRGGVHWGRCEHCGYSFPRIFPPICRAVQDFTKLKGARVDLSLLIETVRDTPGVRQFQIVLGSEDAGAEFSRDLMTLHVAAEREAAPAELERLLKGRVKELTELTPDRLVFEDEAAIEKRLFARTGIKADYVVEKRFHHI
jgi:phenylacetate-CoA ligase